MLDLKRVLLLIGYAVYLFWFAVLTYAFVSFFLGYSIPEILISSEASLSLVGYFILLREVHFPIKKGMKYWKILFACDMCVGILMIIAGAYTIILGNPSLFTYLCLAIGASIILIHARLIQ